jgi:hypothetical protein
MPEIASKIESSISDHSLRVGMFVAGGGGGPAPTTITLAEAVPPAPPSTEVTAPVVLFCVPAVVPVTFTLKVHEALDARVALAKLTLPDPAVAVIVPPPQLPVSPFGVETTRPAGSVSANPTPLNVVAAFGLLIVKLSEVDPFSAMLAAPNDFTIVGGAIAATVTLADAVPPVPPSTDVTAPVVLFFVPSVLPVTFTLKVHEALDARVALAKLTLPDPAVAVIVPPPQLPASPFGVETTRPAGNVSGKPTPVNVVAALGLLMVKLSEVAPFSGMLAAPNDFTIVGGTAAAPRVTRAILFVAPSVYQRLLSGPVTMPPLAPCPPAGTANEVITPAVVIRPITAVPLPVNQRFPSGPVPREFGKKPPKSTGNSVNTPAVVTRSMLLEPDSGPLT